jgi:excisionase family DNA binding protein
MDNRGEQGAQCTRVATSGASAGRGQYLTRSQVARLFEVSPATVSRWTREGKLPCVRTLGGQRRYRRELIEGLTPGPGTLDRPEERGGRP